MRPYSVPMRLANLRRVPMRTQVLANTEKILATEVTPGNPIPVRKMSVTGAPLSPRHFGAIVVQTNELLQSTSLLAAEAITQDLAAAVAEAENRGFLHPDETGSILSSATHFAASGSNAAAIATDLQRLVESVPGCFRPGAAWVMAPQTAAWIAAASPSTFPNLGPGGGMLMNLPVLTTDVMQTSGSPSTRLVALVDPNEILLADDGRVELATSEDTAIELLDDPTNASLGATAAASMVSLFQTNCTATRATHEIAWYARAGAAAYYAAAY
jgi:HK97 family phage major capsid protein